MLQNARITAFTVSELLREDKQGEITPPRPPPPPTHTHTHTLKLGLKVNKQNEDKNFLKLFYLK